MEHGNEECWFSKNVLQRVVELIVFILYSIVLYKYIKIRKLLWQKPPPQDKVASGTAGLD